MAAEDRLRAGRSCKAGDAGGGTVSFLRRSCFGFYDQRAWFTISRGGFFKMPGEFVGFPLQNALTRIFPLYWLFSLIILAVRSGRTRPWVAGHAKRGRSISALA